MSAPPASTADDVVKLDNGPLVRFEQWMARVGLPLTPSWISPNQITLLSGALGIAAGGCFALASLQKAWFAVGAVLVLLHWFGDNLDGLVARTRDQCSATGRFLDIFADAVTFAAIGLGFAACGHAHFGIVATATLLCLLQYVLTVLWIALARIWPFPAFGPAEALLTVIVMALLMLVLPTDIVRVRGEAYSLVDIAFTLTIPGSLIAITTSGVSLYRHLQRQEAEARAAAPR